jgi:hypothetical protein
VPEDRNRRPVPSQARRELGRRAGVDEPVMHEQDADSPELDAARAGEARERQAVGIAADGRDRRQPGELREDRRAPDVARVEDVIDAREDACHRGMQDAVRVGDEADSQSHAPSLTRRAALHRAGG